MTDLLILLGVSLAVSAVGWIYFIYFFSLGYGYGVAALAIAMLIMHSEAATPPTIVLCALLVVFGCRLGSYLLVRERRAAAYRKILYDPQLQQKKPLSVMLTVWIFCAVLYVLRLVPWLSGLPMPKRV